MKIDGVGESFGALVRAARENRQWTQADLAKRLAELLGKDVNPLVITRIESGKRPVPLAEVAALAQLLNLSLDPLINPTRLRGSADELRQRAVEIRAEIDEGHQQEAQLTASLASVNQQLLRARARKDELERELQAIEQAARVRPSSAEELSIFRRSVGLNEDGTLPGQSEGDG
ncbi:helix-turn-helix transcriptional regulator [Streptomyces canus]|uniref:helix-turn-helix domain-containing protein n=1 Tax=Streptomyces canus TaxID=58343 RepID=UPI00386D2BC1|nr:helix-turn-helix transcriptional regulator [Streptomyces canus]